uniref:RING-type E3 ubiquitin transferase n=1 Tax=Davidia involucrata TaxID=16924 RepID=A0A5B6ZBV8_DAVIN
MQGQRSAVGSLPETLSFDHGSTSSNAGIDQQICWNNMRNSAHNHLPDYVISPSDTTITYLNSTSLEGQSLSGWNLGEPSSSGTENQVSHNERKTEHGWSSSMSACTGPSPVLEERRYEPANILSLNNVNVNLNSNQIANGPLFLQSSRSDAIPQDLNISAGFVECGVDDCQVTECPNVYKSGGSENVRISSASSSSNPFGVPSVSGGYLVEEDDGRPGCSMEGRRLSCKRKAFEGNVGQSSMSGSSSYFQRAESSAWHAVPAHYNTCSSLSISTPSEHNIDVSPLEQVNPGLGLGVGGAASENPLALNVAGSTEGSQRNFRVRINPSHQQDSVSANVFSTGGAVAHSNYSSPRHSSRFLALNNSLELRSAPAADNTSTQRQSVVVHVPALRRNLQSSRWSGGSSSRPGNLSGSVISGEVNAATHEESNSTSLPRNTTEHPLFVPATELSNLAQNPTNWSFTGGNMSISRNVASSSRSGSTSGVHPSSAPNWVPHRNPPQYPRRLSEFVRQSLLSSAGSESGGQSSNNSPLRSGPASSHEMVLPSGAGNQGHHLSHSRSAMLLERQLDGAFGIPYSLRTLAAASEGRGRLVSEIRNVLDLMRRGEGLRFEDVMILDQSVFFGMADIHDRIHDRHRDMRLDVDNMSYEELLALEERIGYVNTGLNEETILKHLKQRKYLSIATGAQLEVEPCCICQEQYNDGEDLGTLECGHQFHSGCIKQWLMHKNLCPICKTTALAT